MFVQIFVAQSSVKYCSDSTMNASHHQVSLFFYVQDLPAVPQQCFQFYVGSSLPTVQPHLFQFHDNEKEHQQQHSSFQTYGSRDPWISACQASLPDGLVLRDKQYGQCRLHKRV